MLSHCSHCTNVCAGPAGRWALCGLHSEDVGRIKEALGVQRNASRMDAGVGNSSGASRVQVPSLKSCILITRLSQVGNCLITERYVSKTGRCPPPHSGRPALGAPGGVPHLLQGRG